VRQTSLSSTLAPNGLDASTVTVGISLAPPSGVGPGIHTVTFPINVCFDSGCTRPAQGSPWTGQVTYIVDPTLGIDYTQKSINVSVGGLVWGKQTGKLYAIIPSYSALDPNTLAQINPSSASIESAVQLDGGVGHIEPGTLAVSDDGLYLYVAVSDASGLTDHIERLRTSDLGLDQSIVLPALQTVAALQPAPGAPHTLAVEISGNSPELVIYDDATPRSNTLAGQNGSVLRSFTWGSDASTLYASLRGATVTLDSLSVTSTGVQVTRSLSSPTLPTTPMQFAGGIVCWDSGETFDPVTFALANSFNAPTSSVPSAAFDAALDRAYFVTTEQAPGSTSQTSNIEAFNLSTREDLWLVRIPSQNPPAYLTRWSSDGLAFALGGASDSLVLLSGALITQ
jgi:hypothetical protein